MTKPSAPVSPVPAAVPAPSTSALMAVAAGPALSAGPVRSALPTGPVPAEADAAPTQRVVDHPASGLSRSGGKGRGAKASPQHKRGAEDDQGADQAAGQGADAAAVAALAPAAEPAAGPGARSAHLLAGLDADPAAGGQGSAAADEPAPSGKGASQGGGGHVLPYVLGGVALIGGGLAVASGKGGGGSTTKTPESVDVPSLALAADTGASATDGITNRGTVAVSGLQTTGKWEYSVDAGATWTAGTGSSFNLAQGTYAAGAVQVRQTSAGGTLSAAGKLAGAVTVDTAISLPTINAVTGDNVLTFAEGTAAGGVTVSGTGEPGATISLRWMVQDKLLIPTGTALVDQNGRWTYTFQGTAVPDASQTLETQIKLSATDVAGNSSDLVVQSVTTDPGVTVSGTITAGAVLSGNDLTVNLYAGDGRLLAGNVAVAADGTFRVANLALAKGAVLIASVANGPAPDYTDEATGLARSLSGPLIAALTIGGSAQVLAINPLTTLAAATLGLAVNGQGALVGTAGAAAVDQANAAVSAALGLSGGALPKLVPQVVPEQGFDPATVLSPAQQAGVLLAALSGLDAVNGGDSRITLDGLLRALTVSGASASLSSDGLAALAQGALQASGRLGAALVGQVAALFGTGGPAAAVLGMAPVSGDDVINLADSKGFVLTGTAGVGVTDVSLNLGGRTVQAALGGGGWSYALGAADVAALGSGAAAVILATATLADGTTVSLRRPVALALGAPAVPTIGAVSGGAVNAAERAEGVAVSGSADPWSSVVVQWNGPAHTVQADGQGNWTYRFATAEVPAVDGATNVTARAIDRFGNASGMAERAVTIDLSAPGKPGLDPIGGTDVIGAGKIAGGIEVSGTAEAGATVMVGWGGSRTQAALADAGGHWRLTLDQAGLPSDGTAQLTAYQIDPAGNAGQAETRTVLIARSVTALRLLPVAGGDGVNSDEAQKGITVTGVAPPGSTVVVTWATSDARTVTADGDGYWRTVYQFAEIPVDGSTVLKVGGTDAAGSALTPLSLPVAIDTRLPDAPQIDPISGDRKVNRAERDAGVEVTGSGEAGAKVTVIWNGVSHSATVNDDRTWSVRFAGAEIGPDAVDSPVSAVLTDVAGNRSPARVQAVTVNTSIPAAPSLVLDSDTGPSATDGVTSNGTIRVSGLLPGSTWEYSTDGGANWIAGRNDRFALIEDPDAYAAGRIQVRQYDTAGNPSPPAALAQAVSLQVSRTSILVDRVTDDGSVNAEDRSKGVTVSGVIGNPIKGVGIKVTVSWGLDGTAKTADMQADGTWSVRFGPDELPSRDGTVAVQVRAVSAAGVPDSTVVVSVPVKITPPATPTLSLRADTGRDAADGITTDGTLLIGGNARSAWQYTTDGGATWRDGDLGVSTLLLDPGRYAAGSVAVRLIDGVGNIGQPGTYARALVIDTATPEPTIDALNPGDVINLALKQAGVTVTGTAEAGAVLTIGWNGRTYRAQANDQGQWRLALATADLPADGAWTLTAVAEDQAGNRSAAGGVSRTITLDTAPPTRPVVAVVAGNDVVSGAEKAAGVTISGTSAGAAAVSVDFGGKVKAATIGEGGAWSVTYLAAEVPADAPGVAVTATATNARGNSSSSQPRVLAIDTDAALPTLAVSGGDAVINAADLSAGLDLAGTAEAGAIVVLQLGSASRTVTADAKGNWTARFFPWQLPGDGPATVTATATDATGNVSRSASLALSFDAAAPQAPTVGVVSSDNIVTPAEAAAPVIVNGTAESGATISLRWGNGAVQTAVAGADGRWSIPVAVVPGSATADAVIAVTATDPAGNASLPTRQVVTVVGTTEAGPVLAPIGADWALNADELGKGVRVTGLAAPDSTVVLSWGGLAPLSVITGANGVWTASYAAADLPSVTAANGAAVNFTATVAGKSTSHAVLIDPNPPQATRIDNVGAASGVAGPADLVLTAAEKATGTVRLSGSTEAGATVQLAWAGLTKTVLADGLGKWSVDLGAGELPGDGDSTVSLKAIDVAGNVSTVQQTITVRTAVTGTSAADSLSGVGPGDVLSGRDGDDRLTLVDLAFRSVDGGAGNDTLVLGSSIAHATLDLTRLAAGQLSSIETIDLTGGGANHLVVDAAAILADTGGANRLVVTGNADERVTAFGFVQTGTTGGPGNHLYNIYTNGSATLWVDQAIQHVVL